VVAHHIIVRSPLPLPYETHGWSRAEYVRFAQTHASGDALALVWATLAQWQAREEKEGEEYVRLLLEWKRQVEATTT